jgi:hypothetical protein
VNGVELAPGTPEWTTWFSGLVDEAIAILTADGGRVVWVLPMSEPDPTKSAQLAAVRDVIVDRVEGRSDVITIDGDATVGVDGKKTDGQHLCPLGAERLATAVRTALAEQFVLGTSQMWTTGPWRTDGRYTIDGEGCPAG